MHPDKISLRLDLQRSVHPVLFADLMRIRTGVGRRLRLIGLINMALGVERAILNLPGKTDEPLLNAIVADKPKEPPAGYSLAESDLDAVEGFGTS
jgi:hypothetical protein